jgi:hypothetical protein
MKGSATMPKLEHLRARANGLGLYINHHNNRYSIGIHNDYDADNTTYCCNTKNEVDAFLCGVAYQLYYSPRQPQHATTSNNGNNEE